MSVDADLARVQAERARSRRSPVVIEARGVEKTFRIPSHRIDSFKERATHPFTRIEYREQRVLRGISFDVRQGEFFGIVGRNGSGKSTLLKLLSSIYRADAGTIRMAGRPAPFIELGVGFNPELTSRENVVLNGVMMGLGRREARRRLESILDFAELREFADLKLKNYSSGMMVRLAFAVMVEAEADIMLIDEVLAVGDAAFAQKCMDVFRSRREAGRTLVLVTHDMTTVQELCDRAMLIHDGELAYVGDPGEAAARYYRVNFETAAGQRQDVDALGVPDVNVSVLDAWLENQAGQRVGTVEQDRPIDLRVVLEARRDLEAPIFSVHVVDVFGAAVFGFDGTLRPDAPARVPAGRRIRLAARIDNPLVPGRYSMYGYVARVRSQGDYGLHKARLLDFDVDGPRPGPGSVSVQADLQAVVDDPESP